MGGGFLFTQLAAGDGTSLGRRADGTALAWGDNYYGNLGDGTTTDHATPAPVSGGGLYVQLAAGSRHGAGLRADGTAWAWGYNVQGQLGDGSTTQRLVPTAVSGGLLFTQLAAGGRFNLGLRADGTAWAWGQNTNGQLGDGGTAQRNAPVAVSGGGTYAQLAAGNVHGAGRRADGTAWAWGQNTNGQLGDGSTAQRLAPTREATTGTTWAGLISSSNAAFTLARTPAGYYFASTGDNSSGQLGDGTTANATRFDRVSPLRAFQPLPVELAAFGAARTGPAAVALRWATASEQHNAGFGVEKSADGRAFVRLAFVAGAGSSASARSYSYIDERAPDAAYYRLAQTDADGRVTYSPAQFVAGADGAGSGGLVLVPNPAHGGAVQVLGLPPGEPLTVYDARGRCVRPAAAGLNAAGLAPGLYLVRAGTRTGRLVVE